MPDIVCLGEALVDMVSTSPWLHLVQSPAFLKAAGGAPANVAAACALLGADAGLIARVGEDHFGEFLRQTLHDCGVDLAMFSEDPEHATQLAFVAYVVPPVAGALMQDHPGDRARPRLSAPRVPEFSFHVHKSADQMLGPDDFSPEYVTTAQILHVGSISMIHEPAASATRTAMEIALDEGLIVSMDPNIRPTLWPSMDVAYDVITRAIKVCDFVKVSEQELEFLTGTRGDRGVKALYEMGPELVAATLGPEGCLVYNGVVGLELPSFSVPVLDTTGCGDAFVGAALVGMLEAERDISELEEEDLEKIFTFANAAAAITATERGAIPALPGREEVQELLEMEAEGEEEDEGEQ